ncbi:MAG: M17 family peptidase N-terminal domain-containing protein, partial [Mariprofundaceae bacterium]|nr:M17 family peptidase N-terminal domain-containing protein [Mariprofundaceae bacterium]
MIHIEIGVGSVYEQNDDVVVVPVLQEAVLTASGEALKNMQPDVMNDVLQPSSYWEKRGASYGLYRLEGTQARSTMLLSAGSQKKLTLHALRTLSAKLAADLNQQGVEKAACYLAEL